MRKEKNTICGNFSCLLNIKKIKQNIHISISSDFLRSRKIMYFCVCFNSGDIKKLPYKNLALDISVSSDVIFLYVDFFSLLKKNSSHFFLSYGLYYNCSWIQWLTSGRAQTRKFVKVHLLVWALPGVQNLIQNSFIKKLNLFQKKKFFLFF